MILTLPDGFCIEVDDNDHSSKIEEMKIIANTYLEEVTENYNELDDEGNIVTKSIPVKVLPNNKKLAFSNAFRVLFNKEIR